MKQGGDLKTQRGENKTTKGLKTHNAQSSFQKKLEANSVQRFYRASAFADIPKGAID